jgi:hypothetical protein
MLSIRLIAILLDAWPIPPEFIDASRNRVNQSPRRALAVVKALLIVLRRSKESESAIDSALRRLDNPATGLYSDAPVRYGVDSVALLRCRLWKLRL